MKKIISIMILIMFLLIPAILVSPAILIASDSEAQIVLRNGVDSITQILNDPSFSVETQKNARKETLLNKSESFFDFNEFAKGALGQNWGRFSEKQRSGFTKYFSQLIANTYIAKIDDENFKDLKITYLKTEMVESTKSGIQRADIATEVFHNKIITPVYYKMMKKKGGSWKIYDVKIEGVSLVGNYREQYRTRFNDSPEKIIEEIKEKIQQ